MRLGGEVPALARLLQSPRLTGEVLRVLVRLLRRSPPPENPYSDKELEVLLLLTLALERAGMWP